MVPDATRCNISGSLVMHRISTSLTYGILAASAMLGLADNTRAGDPSSSYSQPPLPRVTAPAGGDGYYGYGHGHSATFQESVLHGQADLVRAHGENALNTAEALRSFEAAEDHRLDNKVKRLAVRQQRQIMGRNHKAEVQRVKLAQRAEMKAAREQERSEAEASLSPAEKAANLERLAANKLALARKLEEKGHEEKAREWMDEIVRDYPGTAAALEISPTLAEQ
jgi:hypothetical protein